MVEVVISAPPVECVVGESGRFQAGGMIAVVAVVAVLAAAAATVGAPQAASEGSSPTTPPPAAAIPARAEDADAEEEE